MVRSLPPIRRTSNALGALRLVFTFPLAFALALSAPVLSGCPAQGMVRPELTQAATSALTLSDALEELIKEGKDTQADREAAYDLVQTLPSETAGDAFGRAAIAGRLAEKKGALAIFGPDSPTSLAAEVEQYARKSRKLDPAFRQGAAARMLGTLYVMAPTGTFEGITSEDGLEILEHLVKESPDVAENQLRMAEAYIAQRDKDAAREPICVAIAKRASLRKDEALLLDKLAKDIEGLDCKAAPPPP
ncbi:MAG: hypothetical protein IPG04_09645 [Polyangiaceae bacterium]|jgi:hypothetical protein|nr:hypothetical protein [Polyangiaceae bacterium]